MVGGVIFKMLNTEKIQLYIDIDSQLNIIKTLSGKMIIPNEDYDLFFLVPLYVAFELDNYRVVLLNGKYELEVIDKQCEQQKKIELGYAKSPEQLQENIKRN